MNVLFDDCLNDTISKDAKIIIARDISTKGHKQYAGFNNIDSLYNYINIIGVEHRIFYEVCKLTEFRKPYFDFDKAKCEGQLPSKDDFIYDMSVVLKESFNDLFKIKICDDDILICDSSVPEKASFHVVMPKFIISVLDMKLLFADVSDRLIKLYEPEEDCDNLYVRLIESKKTGLIKKVSGLDKCVYGSNQCFRLVGSHKMGKTNIKQIINNDNGLWCDVDSLIGVYDSIENYNMLKISTVKPESKKPMGIMYNRNISTTLKPCIKYECDIYEKILLGLNAERSDDYDSWIKICMGIGHEFKNNNEQMGRDILHKFSQQSDKYDAKKTDELFNVGLNGDCKNPITISSILGYLKEDNINLFISALMDMKDYTHDKNFIKEMINFHTKHDNIDSSKEKQEDKIKRWLSNPEFYLSRPVNMPLLKFKTIYDTKKIHIEKYNSKYVKKYNSKYDTLIIKAAKGSGKTHQLEKYINDNNHERIIITSFRKTYTAEMIKRFKKHGFVNYEDIKGPITDKYKRVIIQVESLHRLRWTKKCDLFCVDEIESVKSQFFSSTCKMPRKCLETFEMLTESSKKAFFLDADVSNNTIELIKRFRTVGQTAYIENSHLKKQSGFNEFYTTDEKKWAAKLDMYLKQNKKIVIASTQSADKTNGLKAEILNKYPHLRVALYNSTTIGEENVISDISDVEKSWGKYDVIIYSPTISAGVSFDKKYFDVFFGYFNNCTKINAARQMISRVRDFSTNEFNYCLKTHGGSGMPEDFVNMEKYITSNKFNDEDSVSKFIFSKLSFDGTREYRHKDLGYYLYVHDAIERARDKNKFIYNFLREQYNAGITNIQWMPDIEEKAEQIISSMSIKEQVIIQADIRRLDIAAADVITEGKYDELIKIIDSKERQLSKNELNQIKRYNLLKSYDLPQDKMINQKFIEKFEPISMKRIFKTRKYVKEIGITEMAKREKQYSQEFSRDTGNISIIEDLQKHKIAKKLIIAKELLIKISGFSGFDDINHKSKKDIENGFRKYETILIKKMNDMCKVLGRYKKDKKPVIEDGKIKWNFRDMIRFMNSVLMETMKLKIKETKRRSGLYHLSGLDTFNLNDAKYIMDEKELNLIKTEPETKKEIKTEPKKEIKNKSTLNNGLSTISFIKTACGHTDIIKVV